MAGKYWWEEDKKQTTTQSSTQSSNKTSKKYWWQDDSKDSKNQGYWWDDGTLSKNAGQNIANRVNALLKNYSKYITDYKSRTSGRKYNLEDSYVSDSANRLSIANKQKSDFDAEVDSILTSIEQNKGFLNEEWVKQVKTTLANAQKGQNAILDFYKKDNEYWQGFKDETEYGYAQRYSGKTSTELKNLAAARGDDAEKEWLTSYADSVAYNEKLNFDTVAGEQEVADLEAVYAEMKDFIENELRPIAGSPERYDEDVVNAAYERYEQFQNQYGDIRQLENLIREKKDYLEDAQHTQKYVTLSGVGDQNSKYYDPDFEKYAEIGATADYVAYTKEHQQNNSGTNKGYNAAIVALAEHYDQPVVVYYNDKAAVDRYKKYMRDEEFQTLAYYVAKDQEQGTNLAEQYIDSLEELLTQREENKVYSIINLIATYLPAVKYLYGAYAGLDRFVSGIDSLVPNRENHASSVTQAVSAKIREDQNLFGKVIYDLVTTTSNMVPSILASTAIGMVNPAAGAAVGSGLMGLSSAGHAYQEAINLGYDNGQARLYSALVGASEAGLQYLMGGIGKLGSKITGKAAVNLASKFDNALARVAVQYGSNMLAEGTEEYLQEILTPLFKNIALKTDEEINLISEDAIYSFVLGALSSGVMEGGSFAGNIADVSSKNQANIDAKKLYGGSTAELIAEGLASPVGSESYQNAQIAKRKMDKGKVVSGYEIRQMFNSNAKQIASEITPEAKSRLKELGETKDINNIASLVAKKVSGQQLTRAEISTLARSQYGAQVAKEISGIESDASTDTKQEKVAYKPLEERVGTEAKFNVSDSGQATVRGTDDAISLDKVEVTEFIKDKSGKVTDMVLKVDGKEVKASDIDYADDSQSHLFSAVSQIENISPADAQAIIRDYDPASGLSVGEYLNGIDEGFTYGYHNYSEADLKAGNFAPKLGDVQAKSAYVLGQNASKNRDTSKADAIVRMRTAVEAEAEKAKAEGKEAPKSKELTITVTNEKGETVTIDEADTTEGKQSGGIKVAQMLHKLGLGTNFRFFTSYLSETMKVKDKKTGKLVPARVFLDENGVEQLAPAGVYRMSDGTICIDLNAYNGKMLTLNALAHELTHFIQQWSTKKYKVLVDFLMQTYEDTGITMHQRVLREQERINTIRKANAKANNTKFEPISYNEAFDEVVANAMMKMFDDGKLVERLTEMKVKDKKLAQKLWEGFKEILNKFLGFYQSEKALFYDTDDLMQMKDAFEQLQNMFAEALVEASENFQAAQTIGFEMDVETESVAPAVMHSEQTWSESDYVQQRDDAAKEIAKAIGVSEKKAKDYIDSVNSIAKMIAEDRSRLDYFSSPGRSSFVDNAEYGGSFDFSTLCKKRRLLTGTFTAIQKALPNTALTADEILDIRNRMKKANLEVSCGLCYVEGSRANMGQFAKEFLRLYKQYYPDAWQPNMADVNTPDGIEWVRINHPECYEQYEYFWNHYGTLKDGDKNLFASQQKPKLYQLHTEYKGEILNKFKNDDKVDDKNLNGGIRLQSFSDFEIVHLIDTMQIIMDMSRVGLAGQAYTKVPDFAWALGDTGLKINLSLIAKGVDENGKLIFDDVEGMPIAEAMKLRDRYSKNVGTILVAFNDAQLLAAMADDRVDFIIPFHRSQWKKSQYEAMGLPAKTKDYTFMQNEKFIKPTYHEYRGRMVKDKATNYMPNEYWDFSKSGKENAEAYLEMCARNNKRPKFYKLLTNNGDGSYSLKADGSTDGYWKLLIDFKMYDNDGIGSPQMAVKPEFNMEEATRMLNDYSGGHSNFPVAQGIVDEFVKDYKDSHKGQMYSSQETDADAEGFKDYDIVSAVYTIRNEKAQRRQDLVKIGDMPKLYRDLFELTGDVFVSNEHLYQNMVSKATAIAEGRYKEKTDDDDGADYHELGEEKVINAIEQFQDPMVIMESLKDFKEPRLVAILEEKGNDGENLIAVLELYSKQRAYGSEKEYSHVLITIYEKSSLPDYVGKTVEKGRVMHIKNGLPSDTLARLQLSGDISKETLKKNVAQFNKKVKAFKEKNNIQYSSQETDADNAPTFYSQMGKVVEGMKQDKFGASSVISMLRGRGVKAEEIRWSGIQAFLDGKKSVTKAELLEFINGSMLNVEEETRGGEALNEFALEWMSLVNNDSSVVENLVVDDKFLADAEQFLQEWVDDGDMEPDEKDRLMELAQKAKDSGKPSKWDQYKLDGGKNYRELVFKMPGATHTNQAMKAHWGEDAQGVLAHARMQDFDVDGKKMLFIEEIQSDWHNEGHKTGYVDESMRLTVDNTEMRHEGNWYKLYHNGKDLHQGVTETFLKQRFRNGITDAEIHKGLVDEYNHVAVERKNGVDLVPDAPFKGNYHEYVLKRLLRMAAEEGYDSIGWTTADIQSERWSDEYAEGYRIEYDQDIPKFLRKYGKQWGAEVGKSTLPSANGKSKTAFVTDGGKEYSSFNDAVIGLVDEANKQLAEDGIDLVIRVQDLRFNSENGTTFVEDEFGGILGTITKNQGPATVWSMDITPAMKQSVLKEGQVMYSTQETDNISNRDLLANAFESISQNSEEYKLIQRYKNRIQILNELEEKLSKLNAEIRQIRFGKDAVKDMAKLQQLEAEAKNTAKLINAQDKKLLSLEASEPLRKVIEQERKKEAQKTKDHVKEIQQNRKVKAEQAEIRHKIRKAIRDLDKILNRGNKKQNVKEDMQVVVSKALKAADILFTDNFNTYDMLRNGLGVDLSDAEEALVNTCTQMLKDLDKMPTDGYDNWQAYQEAESKLKTKMSKLNDVFARERKRLNNTTVSSILGELADAYASLENSEQSYVQGAYTEAVHNYLKNLQNEVGGTIVKDMTKDQLESVYAAYKMVLNTVRNANKMFNKELKQSREQLGNAVIEEVIKAGGVHLLGTKMGDKISQFDWNNMKPIWVGNRIGSDTFGKLMDGLFKGQYDFAVDIAEAKKFKLEMDEKYHPRDWDAKKSYEFESSTGKKFNLDLQQIMSLYAYTKRGEQAIDHLISGGFVFEKNSTVIVEKDGKKKSYIHKGAASYKLNEATLNGIINSLTPEQKAYVDEMQAYLSDVMGAKGNEVSMALYGIKMFNEQFYFPLRSSGAYMERAKEAEMKKQQGQINLVNSGFTHSVKPKAKNPIILAGFMDVWAEHCNEMSMYHSMVLPMEDFRKVYNYTTVHDENMESASVFQTIQDAYGEAATSYIDQLYKELNAGATIDPRETVFKQFISNFKKSAVMLSGSVVVQQFSAIGRAYAVIDPRYFVGSKVNSDTGLSAVEEMKKYAPVAIIKEMGGFDTGTKGNATSYIKAEEYHGVKDKAKGFFTDKQYRGDVMGFLPAWADEKTWCAIWEAAKRETKAKHPDMDVKSDAFLKLAGELFSEAIEKTQVYDSVLARSANMRSKGAFMNMATAFMAEPTTTVNLIESAIRTGKAKNIARAFGAVAVSIVLNNALASIVYAMRDDDEDETFIEKYFQSFTSGMIDDINPMTYYPFLKDVWSLFQGYDVERSDMSVIADVRDALKQAYTLLAKDTSNMTDDELAEHNKKLWGALGSVLDAGCSAFGVPIKNVRRDAMGIVNAWNTVSKDVSGERSNSWNSFWDKVGSAAKDAIPFLAWTKDKSKADKLYDAIMSGDKAYLERIKSGYKDEDAYTSAVRTALRENDSRIHDAAQARYNGNIAEYKRIFKEIQNEGKFSFDDIMEAINSEESKIRNGEKSDAVSSDYSAKDFVNAIIVGENSNANAIRENIISTKVANGMTRQEAEKSFYSSVSSSTRDAFDTGLLNEAGAKKMLMEYADMDKEDATSRADYWALTKANPKYRNDLNESNVKDYREFAEPAGISLDVFVKYLKGTNGLTTIYDKWGDVEVSKREQVLEVIDSLPLTWQQKDALYLAHGYSENTIWDVPW